MSLAYDCTTGMSTTQRRPANAAARATDRCHCRRATAVAITAGARDTASAGARATTSATAAARPRRRPFSIPYLRLRGWHLHQAEAAGKRRQASNPHRGRRAHHPVVLPLQRKQLTILPFPREWAALPSRRPLLNVRPREVVKIIIINTYFW